jgi:uncharacterized integral membrane protein
MTLMLASAAPMSSTAPAPAMTRFFSVLSSPPARLERRPIRLNLNLSDVRRSEGLQRRSVSAGLCRIPGLDPRSMQFLKTLFWVVLAVFVAIIARNNWTDVTINLWGSLQADIKLPLLVLLAMLIGFLPPFLILRARLWSARRRLLTVHNQPAPEPAPAISSEGTAA